MSPDMQSTLSQMTGAGNAGKSGAAGAPAGIPDPFASGQLPGQTSAAGHQKTARAPGSLPQEAKYMAEDVAQGLLSLLPDIMQQILGVKSTDKPEEAARKKQMLQRYTQLNDEQQQVVQKQMRESQEKKQKEEEEKAKKRQEEQASASDDLPIPQGTSRGEGGPGASGKQRTTTKLQNDRKKLSSAG
jgi:hypothetical protein